MILESLFCLALNIHNEAKGEPEIGQLAVGIVTINRSVFKNKSICQVVLEPYQFSWYNFKPILFIPKDKETWEKSKLIAKKALEVHKINNFDNIQYYHNYSVKPTWSYNIKPIMVIGNHIFYK